MHSPRAQADKKGYQNWIKARVEYQEDVDLRQELVEDLLTEYRADGQQRVVGVLVRGDVEYRADAVVLTTGTFMSAIMHTGEAKTPGGLAAHWQRWVLNLSDSRQVRHPVSTDERLTLASQNCNRVMRSHKHFPF